MKKQQSIFTGDPETRFAIGSAADGFMFKRALRLPGGAGNVYEFEHAKSGAHWLHCETEETKNQFSVAFRTPVGDDRGIPHILEHMVLSGSKKYPAEDMFDKLRSRTCIFDANATTTSEFTKFYFSSVIDDEFFAVADCILDAVFNPRLDDSVFYREAWRYTSTGNRRGALSITGVVYNEVKADWRRHWFDHWLFNKLMPGSSRSHWSGGRPSAILELSNRDVRHYHQKWYKASNAYVVTQGPIPLETIRRFLDGFFKDYMRQDIKFPESHPMISPMDFDSESFEVQKDKFRDADVGIRPNPTRGDDAKDVKEVAAWHVPYPIGSRENRVIQFALDLILNPEGGNQDTRSRRFLLRARRRKFANNGDLPFCYKMSGWGAECLCFWSWCHDDEYCHDKLIEEVKRKISEVIDDANFVKRLVKSAQEAANASCEHVQYDVCDDDDVLANWMFKSNPFVSYLQRQTQLVFLEVRDNPDMCLELLREIFLQNRSAVNVELICGDGDDNEVVDAEKRAIRGLTPAARKKVLALDEKIRQRQGAVRKGKRVDLPKTLIENIPVSAWMPEHTVEEDHLSKARVCRIGRSAGTASYCGVYVDCGDMPIEQYVWLDVWTRLGWADNVIAIGGSRGGSEKMDSLPNFVRLRDESALRGGQCDGLFAMFPLGVEVESARLDSLFEVLSTRDPLRFRALCESLSKGRYRFADDILEQYLKKKLSECGTDVDWESIAREMIRDASAAADKIHNPARWTFVLQATDRLFEEYKKMILDRCRSARVEHYQRGASCSIEDIAVSENEVSGIKTDFTECDKDEDTNVCVSVPIDAESLRRYELEIHLGSYILDANFARVEFRERSGAYGARCRFNAENRTLDFEAGNVSDVGRVVNAVMRNLIPYVRDAFKSSRDGASATIFKDAARKLALGQIKGAVVAYDENRTKRFRRNVRRILLGATAGKIKSEIINLSNTQPEIVKGVLLDVLEKGLPNLRVTASATRAMLEDANKVLPESCRFQLDRKKDEGEELISAAEFFGSMPE